MSDVILSVKDLKVNYGGIEAYLGEDVNHA